MGAKHSTSGNWKDCPAYDLEPMASRNASVSVSISRQQRGRKASAITDSPPPLQTPSSGAQQPPGPGGPVSPAATSHLPSSTGHPAALASTAAPQDASCSEADADSLNRDHDRERSGGDGGDVPSPAPRDRTHNHHRLALRLLERKGALADTAPAGKGTQSTASESAPLPQLGPAGRGSRPTSAAGSSGAGSAYGSPQATVPPSPSLSTGYYTPGGGIVSPARPGGSLAAGGGAAESAVEADERMCLRASGSTDLDDGMSVAGPGHSQAEYVYRQSGTGLAAASPTLTQQLKGISKKRMWGGAQVVATSGPIPAMRGSDYGGGAGPAGPGGAAAVMASSASASAVVGPTVPLIGPRTVPPPPPLLVMPAGGGGFLSPGTPATPATPPVGLAVAEAMSATQSVLSPAPSEPPGERTSDRYRFTPRAWSAAGGRQELSQEEKEWLFGRPGGIGGLQPVLALGEGGEGVVDLVRLDLPGRTLHLARKATRTSVPSFALNGSSGPGVAMLGITRNVAYRFPFEFFDREVRAMKAVKESGFVIRFQAAAYDHDKGQGYILMEAAPYGTLQDLHNALCRSAMHSGSRQRAPLLQRAIAKFTATTAKASAPPSLAPPGPVHGGGGSGRHQSLHVPAERTSRQQRGPGRDTVELAPEAEPDVGYATGGTGNGCSDRFSCCSASTVGSPEHERLGGGGTTAHAATAPASPGIGTGVGAGGGGMGSLGASLMGPRALRYYGACMLQALVALHDAGYVYRDLKLSNVLVCEGGRVRLTDFGSAATSLADQPGLFGGVAGTRLYLAPELLPWLDAPPPGEGSGRPGRGGRVGHSGGGGAMPPPYTVTVDSWTWGLVMVELATGWSIKELTQRVIRRVCHPRSPTPPDLPADAGIPPLLRQLLLDHVLLRDPAARWSAARIRGHRFFEGVDWERLAEAEGPHAHLFVGNGHASNAAVDPTPGAVAAAMRAAEAAAAANGGGGGGRKGGALAAGNFVSVNNSGGGGEVLLKAGGSPLGGPGGYVMASMPQNGNSINAVTAFTGQRSTGGGGQGAPGGRGSRPTTGTGVLPVPPMVLPPGSFASVTGPTGAAAQAAAEAMAAAVAAAGPTAGDYRASSGGFATGGPVAERRSSPGNVPLIGPVVMPPGGGILGGVGAPLGPRRHTHTNIGYVPPTTSRLATGTTAA